MKVFLPYRGEFGHKVMWHIQQVNACEEPKIICCEEGEEALFPGAESYITAPRKLDRSRRELCRYDTEFCDEFKRELEKSLPVGKYEFIYPSKRGPKKYFVPQPYIDLKIECDLVVCPRRRAYGHRRNWKHWPWLIDQLLEAGVKVFAAGAPDSSWEVNCPKAWDYDRYLDATLTAMQSSKLVTSTDSGLAHLSLICGRPLLMICAEGPRTGPGDQGVRMGRFHADNHLKVEHTLLEAWEEPYVVLDQIRKKLG